MVYEPVDHGRRDGGVAEDLAPATEGLVGRDDHAGALVTGRDQLEEQVGGLGLEGDVADLVNDQQRDPAEPLQRFVQSPRGVLGGESVDPGRRGGTRDPMTGLTGAVAPNTTNAKTRNSVAGA